MSIAAKADNAVETVIASVTDALHAAETFDAPYRHWLISDLLPRDIAADLRSLELPVADLGGVSGKRELHNETRHYFDTDNIRKHNSVASVAHAFQSPRMVDFIENFFAIDLADTLLRIEYAQDVTGFWLEPHTDLGVKKLTMLMYLKDDADQGDLGTDIFDENKNWVKRSPFANNAALAFVPGDATYHGFVEREIDGVRKSLILNYVTQDWRDREQLAFPETPVKPRAAQ